MAHSKKCFGHSFNRQMLSQKEWNGRKIIAEAFSEAKSVLKRMHNDSVPKYRNAPRTALQKRIAELGARIMALAEELEKVRAQTVDELDAFLNIPRDLLKRIEDFAVSGLCWMRVAIGDELKTKRAAKERASIG